MYIDWVRYSELTASSPTPAPASNLTNPSFEIDQNNDTFPDNWNRTNSNSNDKRIASTAADGAYIYQMSPSSSTTVYKSVNQPVTQAGRQYDAWNVRVWTRTSVSNPSGNVRVRIAFKNAAGKTLSASKALTRSTAGGYQSVTIKAPHDFASMTVFLESSVIQGNVYLDNVSLQKP
jgi:hypothetical protein